MHRSGDAVLIQAQHEYFTTRNGRAQVAQVSLYLPGPRCRMPRTTVRIKDTTLRLCTHESWQ
jgi:hypothetical protein